MYPPQVLNSLKDGLAAIYWYKGDLRRFLDGCDIDRSVVNSLDWQAYKIYIAGDLVDKLVAKKTDGLRDVRELIRRIIETKSFAHLEQLEGGRQKAANAQVMVERLRLEVTAHDQKLHSDEAERQQRREEASQLSLHRRLTERVAVLKNRFIELWSAKDANRRGYELETLMFELLQLCNLEPRLPYRNPGEQIDGAFTLDGIDYLLECKWQKDPVDIQDLDAFGGKIKRRLDNTLGLFVSINGFSKDGVVAHSIGRPSLLLMDGADLLAVLEERIDLVELLRRKRRRAAEGGGIYYTAREMLNS